MIEFPTWDIRPIYIRIGTLFPTFIPCTCLQIAVSPQPRAAGENVSVVLGNNLALKVEGVINQVIAGTKYQLRSSGTECSSTAKGFRRPKAIRMAVSTTPTQPSRSHSIDMKVMKVSSEYLVSASLF